MPMPAIFSLLLGEVSPAPSATCRGRSRKLPAAAEVARKLRRESLEERAGKVFIFLVREPKQKESQLESILVPEWQRSDRRVPPLSHRLPGHRAPWRPGAAKGKNRGNE